MEDGKVERKRESAFFIRVTAPSGGPSFEEMPETFPYREKGCGVKLGDLLADVQAQVPEKKRKAVEEMAEEFGAGETFRFLMMLLAASGRRERRIARLLLRELEKIDLESSGERAQKVDIREE